MKLKWWMRAVGSFYFFLFIACVFLKIPIQKEGPPTVLPLAESGDAVAQFAVDTWVTIGIGYAVLSAALFFYSRFPQQARSLIWTIIAWEGGGIIVDIFKLSQGYDAGVSAPFMIIHAVAITTGLLFLRK